MPNLKQASSTAKAKYNSKKPNSSILSQLGTSKLSVDTSTLLDSMQVAIGEFIDRVLQNIDAAVGKTGAPLINTGEITNITAEETKNGWVIKAPKQLDYQSKGVSGTERRIPNSPYAFSGSKKSVNLDAIKIWVKSRGIAFENMTEDQTAFIIARSIYKNGIDPKNLWEKEIDKLKEDIGEEVANQIAASISVPATKDIKIQ